jgi:glutathione S-transferase
MKLVIGTRVWSSWSLRPWLVMKRAGLDFEEILVKLRWEGTTAALQAYSPSGSCPVLLDGDLTVWDSLAICEYLADVHPKAALWPADVKARALGRAACAQMHSGFSSLRGECPMALEIEPYVLELTEATQADIRKLIRLWSELRARFSGGGPFLLGAWSIADAFYTPVATRLRTYGVDLDALGDDGACTAYADLLLAQPEYLEWLRLAREEHIATGT